MRKSESHPVPLRPFGRLRAGRLRATDGTAGNRNDHESVFATKEHIEHKECFLNSWLLNETIWVVFISKPKSREEGFLCNPCDLLWQKRSKSGSSSCLRGYSDHSSFAIRISSISSPTTISKHLRRAKLLQLTEASHASLGFLDSYKSMRCLPPMPARLPLPALPVQPARSGPAAICLPA